MVDDICIHCKQPILAGQARFGGGEPTHYDCHKAKGIKRPLEELHDQVKKADEGLARIRALRNKIAR